MAKIVREGDLSHLQGSERYWAYNAMDCCVTREVWDNLRVKLTDTTEKTYRFELALQAPAQAMMQRGIAVDHAKRAKHIGETKDKIAQATDQLQLTVAPWWKKTGQLEGKCHDGKNHLWPRGKKKRGPDGLFVVVVPPPPLDEQNCGRCGRKRIGVLPFEPTSHQQCKALLYDDLGLPKMFDKKRKVSVDKECLERLAIKVKGKKKWSIRGVDATGEQLADLIVAIRGVRLLDKLRGMLESELDPDGRWRYSLNIGATETGRPSSSESPMGTGSNTQNIPERMRDMFTADPGWIMFNPDLTTAESMFVAYRSGDEGYINAHKSGDVHTTVCRGIWPELPWTGDLKKDKEVAETNPPWSPEAGHTYRFHAKRRQHGGNYGMSAFAAAMQLRIKVAIAQRDLNEYFAKFPRIKQWHHHVMAQVKQHGVQTSVLGRRRQFFGRSWDEHTFREALANEPQGVIGDLVLIAMWHIWQEFDPGVVRLFQNGYDSLLGQVREKDADWVLPRVLEHMTMTVDVPDIYGEVRQMVIPADMKVGYNWGKFHAEKNPKGMKSWTPKSGT